MDDQTVRKVLYAAAKSVQKNNEPLIMIQRSLCELEFWRNQPTCENNCSQCSLYIKNLDKFKRLMHESIPET
jgi:hypothetical protein